MANFLATIRQGIDLLFKSIDTGINGHVPFHALTDQNGNPISSTTRFPVDTGVVDIGVNTVKIIGSFARPADTTAYASGDLVANSTTAGSVVPLSFAASRVTGKGGRIRRARLAKNNTSLTNASFRVHIYNTNPTCTNGDNGVWLTTGAANYCGSLDITTDRAFSDGASGIGVSNNGSDIHFTTDTLYGLIEARGAYTPASAETFTVALEIDQN